MIALLMITDGRGEYLQQSVASLRENLHPWPEIRTIVDDSGDADYANFVLEICPDFDLIHHFSRLGMAATVEDGWDELSPCSPYVFHAEDDFVYEEHVNLGWMSEVLTANPHLAQLVLKRFPVSVEEINAGGQIETAPDQYEDKEGFVEHRVLFSFNPSLIRTSAMRLAIDAQNGGLERGVTDALLPAGYSFAYLGQKSDPPKCRHIGEHRSAGYRW